MHVQSLLRRMGSAMKNQISAGANMPYMKPNNPTYGLLNLRSCGRPNTANAGPHTSNQKASTTDSIFWTLRMFRLLRLRGHSCSHNPSVKREQSMAVRPLHIALIASNQSRNSWLRNAGLVGDLSLCKSGRNQLENFIFPVHISNNIGIPIHMQSVFRSIYQSEYRYEYIWKQT